MTEAQAFVYEFIAEFTAAFGYPPTVREIAKASGRSTSAAHDMLWRLRNAGVVTWKVGSPRTIRVLSGGSPS